MTGSDTDHGGMAYMLPLPLCVMYGVHDVTDRRWHAQDTEKWHRRHVKIVKIDKNDT